MSTGWCALWPSSAACERHMKPRLGQIEPRHEPLPWPLFFKISILATFWTLMISFQSDLPNCIPSSNPKMMRQGRPGPYGGNQRVSGPLRRRSETSVSFVAIYSSLLRVKPSARKELPLLSRFARMHSDRTNLSLILR